MMMMMMMIVTTGVLIMYRWGLAGCVSHVVPFGSRSVDHDLAAVVRRRLLGNSQTAQVRRDRQTVQTEKRRRRQGWRPEKCTPRPRYLFIAKGRCTLPVFTGAGSQYSAVFTGVQNDARVDGLWTRVVLAKSIARQGFLTQPVNASALFTDRPIYKTSDNKLRKNLG